MIETGRRCRQGEGPYWSVRQQALYWVDILGQTVLRLRPTDGSVATWQLPEMIGWLIERANCGRLCCRTATGHRLPESRTADDYANRAPRA